jgi:eukaryotic-like serine/threonine-protein kinase
MSEVWTQWEGQLIDGSFPLLRFISASDHSAVFLTEHLALNFSRASIKIIPADPSTEAAVLSRWRTAATLPHPHLIRLLDSGRCQLGDRPFLFVVMEYAGETLAEVLPMRALNYDEVREMLTPALDVLTFLHEKNLVQGDLRPSNILVVDDRPKLASDTICAFGEYAAGTISASPYDSPEGKGGKIGAASDIWALGITIVEALTQRPPAEEFGRHEIPSLPATVPAIFADATRRCLSLNPGDRPSVAELKTLLLDAPAMPAIPVPPRVEPTAADRVSLSKKPERRSYIQTAAVLLIILIALWAGLRLTRSGTHNPQSTSATDAFSPAPTATAPSFPPSANTAGPKPTVSRQDTGQPDRKLRPAADATAAVLHEEMPDVPRSATLTIRGRFNISVLVTVDSMGNVVGAALKNAGPSQYFAHASTAAARKWKFVPADTQDSRAWLLQFDFSRGGVAAKATSARN